MTDAGPASLPRTQATSGSGGRMTAPQSEPPRTLIFTRADRPGDGRCTALYCPTHDACARADLYFRGRRERPVRSASGPVGPAALAVHAPPHAREDSAFLTPLAAVLPEHPPPYPLHSSELLPRAGCTRRSARTARGLEKARSVRRQVVLPRGRGSRARRTPDAASSSRGVGGGRPPAARAARVAVTDR